MTVGLGPMGTGAWEVGVMSLGSLGCGLRVAGCDGGNSSRGVLTRVGEAGPLYVDEAGDSVESL